MLRFPVIAVTLATAIVWQPVVPPDHVHEVDDHGHSHAVVHRHAVPHDSRHPAPDHDGVIFNGDAPALTLKPTFTVSALVVSIGEPPNWTSRVVQLPTLDPAVARTPDVEPLIHGPPRVSVGLRGPPSLPPL